MDAIASRTGRQSSRYGSAPVFTGPVRRWQKQWVHVSSSSSSTITYNNHNNRSSSSNNNNDISAVRIRRWTPVPASPAAGESEAVAEERPRRKLRYAPIVVLESKKKEAERSDPDVKEASKTSQPVAQGALENDDDKRKVSNDGRAAKAQASKKSTSATKDLNNQPMDLDIDEDDGDDDEDHDLGGADN